MTAAEQVLHQFDELPQQDQQEVAREILRRTVNADAPSLSDEQLMRQADELFHTLDEEEAADVQGR
jgi:hypothetical protein